MKHPQDPRFKRYLLMAYGVCWGGILSTMFMEFLFVRIFDLSLHRHNTLPFLFILLFCFLGALLLYISTFYLQLSKNKTINLILCFLVYTIQIGINFIAYVITFLLYHTEVMHRNHTEVMHRSL